MKVFYWFLGLSFLISISVNQSVEASNPIPVGLQSAIEHVKKMIRSGASKKDIAAYVTKTVANRVMFLNHTSKRIDSVMGDAKLEKKLERYDAFLKSGMLSTNTFSAAAWTWENRMGQCDDSANTALHILIMAYESNSEVTTIDLKYGGKDHRFIILGDIKNIPNPFSPDDLRKLDDTYP